MAKFLHYLRQKTNNRNVNGKRMCEIYEVLHKWNVTQKNQVHG